MIKFIIAKGIGFSPASVKYIVTHGFLSSAPSSGPTGLSKLASSRLFSMMKRLVD